MQVAVSMRAVVRVRMRVPLFVCARVDNHVVLIGDDGCVLIAAYILPLLNKLFSKFKMFLLIKMF